MREKHHGGKYQGGAQEREERTRGGGTPDLLALLASDAELLACCQGIAVVEQLLCLRLDALCVDLALVREAREPVDTVLVFLENWHVLLLLLRNLHNHQTINRARRRGRPLRTNKQTTSSPLSRLQAALLAGFHAAYSPIATPMWGSRRAGTRNGHKCCEPKHTTSTTELTQAVPKPQALILTASLNAQPQQKAAGQTNATPARTMAGCSTPY